MSWLKAVGSIVVVLAMTVALSAAPAHSGARADIPFAFQLNGKTFAPGVYTFASAPTRGMLTMTGPDGRQYMMMSSALGDPNKQVFDPRLSFVKTNNGLMLNEVWISAGFGGHRIQQPAPATGQRVEIALAMLRY